jgi:hypothetical protein
VKYTRDTIHRQRLKQTPKLPKCKEDVHDYLNSVIIKIDGKEEDFVLTNDKDKSIIVFTCQSNIDFMCRGDIFYADGTFNFCTKKIKEVLEKATTFGRPCRWWRGLSNRNDAWDDAGGRFALLAGSPMPARLERTGEKQRTAQPSGSTTKVVARELANPGEIRATVGRTRINACACDSSRTSDLIRKIFTQFSESCVPV